VRFLLNQTAQLAKNAQSATEKAGAVSVAEDSQTITVNTREILMIPKISQTAINLPLPYIIFPVDSKPFRGFLAGFGINRTNVLPIIVQTYYGIAAIATTIPD
jgi:hypothetical protein